MSTFLIAFLTLLVLAAFVAAFYIIRNLRQSKARLRKLATDFGRESLDSGTTYEGEQDGCKFYYEYYAGSKNRPSYFRIWLEHPSPVEFRINPERGLDRLFKRLGIAVEIQTGDGEFDRLFYVRTDHATTTRAYLDGAETRAAVKTLHRHGFGQISHDGRIVEARISPFRLGSAPPDIDTDTVVGQLLILAGRLPDSSLERRFAGMPAWKFRRNAVYAGNAVVAAAGLGLLYWGLSAFTPLHAFELFRYSMEYTLPVLLLAIVLMTVMLKGRSSSHTDLLINLGIAAIGLPLAGFGACVAGNGALDESPVSYRDATVTAKRYSSSRNSRNYYVSLKSWNRGSNTEEIRVSASIYGAVRAGSTVMTVATRPGRLGFEWIVDYRIKDSP